IGDPRLVCEVLDVAGAALVDYAPIDGRLSTARGLLTRATAVSDLPRALRRRARLAMEDVTLGDFAAFSAEVDAMLDLSKELGHPRFRWRPLLFASMRALASGSFEESERH